MRTWSSFAASLVALTLVVGSVATAATSPARGQRPVQGGQQPPRPPASTSPVSAPGAPLVDCTGASLAQMESGMTGQREWLRKSEDMLKAAEKGNVEATAATEEIATGLAKKAFQAWAQRQLTLIRTVRDLKLAGVSAEKRRQLLTRVDRLQKSWDAVNTTAGAARSTVAAGTAGIDYGTAVSNNIAELRDFATFLDESGIADELAGAAASAFLSPIGGLVVEGAMLGRDVLFAAAQQHLSDQELAQMRANHETMRWAVNRNQEKIDRLRGLMSGCPNQSQAQGQMPPGSPLPIPPQVTPPPPPAPPAPEPKKNVIGKMPKNLAIILGTLVGAGTLGTVVLSKALAEADGAGSGSGSGGTVKFVRIARPFVCSGSTCSGQVVIDFPVVMSSGSIIVQSTSIFLGSATVNPTTPPGEVTFTMTRPYNTCYQTQTNLGIWNSTSTLGPNAYSLSVNIPVSCQ